MLCALDQDGLGLREARESIERFPQVMENVAVAEPKRVIEHAAVAEAVAGTEARLGSRGRVLLRPSGTEPVVRVMVEGEDPEEIAGLARELAEVVRGSLV